MTPKIIELAKKIKALADNGVGGEKLNAQRMLLDLCRKHGINPAMLDEEKRAKTAFDATKLTEQILTQVIYMVVGREGKVWKHPRKKYAAVSEVTEAQRLEILAMYKVYASAFMDTLELLQDAFIQKNRLFPPKAEREDDEEEDDTPQTPENLARLIRLSQMMDGLEKTNYYRQIGAGRDE